MTRPVKNAVRPSKIVPFPKKPGRLPRNVLRLAEMDVLPPNVEAMIEHGHRRRPPDVSRSPELLIAICILQALPDDVRRETKRHLASVCEAFPEDESARKAMSLAARIF